jgi:L-iditol 2-dehydrogenase
MSHESGAIIEPLAVAVRAMGQAGDITGKNAVVIGAGPIGNLVAQTARGMGAESVLVTDINSYRLAKAKECGLEHTVNTAENSLGDSIISLFGAYRRADVIFDCAGVDASISSAVSCARKGSAIVVVAVFENKPALDLALINENELKLFGTARYTITDFRRAIDLVRQGLVDLSPLVSKVIDFSDYQRAYKIIQDHPETTMKIQIEVQ